PCVVLFKPEAPATITADCTGCTKCIKELGCPALLLQDGIVSIDNSLCNGCNLCVSVCPFDAIESGGTR
ncbi:MAG: 4Fe-4S binding protein, partial [Actinobacteria bacterium]|nr:4Fe-4S binding protein [Actinomycetota bacterium]